MAEYILCAHVTCLNYRRYIMSRSDYSISLLNRSPVADLHSKILDARPPWGSKFFQFHAVFGKIWQNRMLAPPRRVGAPSSGKSWIRHWSRFAMSKSFHFFTGRNEVVAKVIFLHLFVILFTGGGFCLNACWDTTPPDQADPPSPDQMPPPDQADPPPPRDQEDPPPDPPTSMIAGINTTQKQ